MAIKIFIFALLNLALGYGLAMAATRGRGGEAQLRRRAAEAGQGENGLMEAEAQESAAPLESAAEASELLATEAATNLDETDGAELAAVGPSNLTSRAALERALADWWRRNPDPALPVTVGLIAVDQLRQITGEFGASTANHVLERLAEVVAAVTRNEDLVARSAGSRLLVFFPDTPANDSTAALERVRQTIGATQFLKGPEMLEVSVTCSVAERAAGDTPEDLLERVEATLLDARRSGGNRTFLRAGTFSAPVPAPALNPEIHACTL